LRLDRAKIKSTKAPAPNRIEVKLAASMLECVKAARESKELPAKAMIERIVNVIVCKSSSPYKS
jgi:hypothetical protein